MPQLEFICELDAPLEKVWNFYNDIASLKRLTPPHTRFQLEGEALPMGLGVIYHFRVGKFGISLRWDAEIVEYVPKVRFVDRQVRGKGPFRFWEHRHLFEADSNSRTRMTDHVTYEVPFGPLGILADRLFARRAIRQLFAFRHKATREWLRKAAAH